MNKLTKWENLLKDREAFCYFKPNRYVHESGFRCLEIGYCTMGDNNKIKEKKVLNRYCDHIWTFDASNNNGLFAIKTILNLDITKDGYIRIFSNEKVLWWGSFDWTVSTSEIKVLD